MSLSSYISVERGRAVKLARQIGVLPVLISQWAAGRPVPVQHCAALEAATDGAVTRQQLRPDDWRRIWPELANQGAEVPPGDPGPQDTAPTESARSA